MCAHQFHPPPLYASSASSTPNLHEDRIQLVKIGGGGRTSMLFVPFIDYSPVTYNEIYIGNSPILVGVG